MLFDTQLAQADVVAEARQVAALPWSRDGAGARRVMLITSRETRRWIIPKGWTIDGLTEAESAAREAFEEAGVEGRVDPSPLGTFGYHKQLSRKKSKPVSVVVFPLFVLSERDEWPERAERARAWFSPDHAASLVHEPELAALLRALD
jgi:8-oxo-dGTP pyrophosphatase MutT (NUDIX family)